ncbi:hypothetical protein K492DRAFT_175961 [Lichtheimia hyalospora FSU 10163]|nr:hypothetical protein K492DRAFT_175961 [Lichtheimia hyalospora FSU 10163]
MSRQVDTPRPILIDHFLKEALQILKHASMAVTAPDSTSSTSTSNSSILSDQGHESVKNENELEGGSVTWRLNFTSSMITLDTNIQTIAGLDKVIEQLSINVQPRPVKSESEPGRATYEADQYGIPGFLHAVSMALHLSSVFPIPKADMFRQFNSMQLMHQCVQAFVMCDGAIQFNIPQLLQQTDKVLSNPSASKEHPIETLLVLSICTVMIRHVMVHKRGHPAVATGLMQAYYSHARILLQDLFDIHHISIVQSLLILSLYPKGHIDMISPGRISSPSLAMAIRMALAMNLHQLDADRVEGDESIMNSEDKERWRRLAWMILCADYFAERNESGQMGRINVTNWQVDFPRPLPGESPYTQRRVEYLSQYSRIVMLRKMNLFGSAYRIVLQSPRALESSMDEMLFKTYMNTPPTLQLNLDISLIDKYTKTDIEPLLLHSLYYDTLISTHIPFLPKHYLDSLDRDRPMREACVSDIYQRISQSCPQQQQRIFIPDIASFTTTTTGTVLSSDMNKNNSNHSAIKHEEMPSKDDIEFHSIIGCIEAASNLTLVLEILGRLDPMGCHRSPIYGGLVTAHLYHVLEINSDDLDVKHVCQINLIRTMRLLQQSGTVFADSAMLYLDRILRQWITVNNEEPTHQLQHRAAEIIQGLKKRARTQLLTNNQQQHEPLNHIKLEESA